MSASPRLTPSPGLVVRGLVSLGAVLAWSQRQGIDDLHIIADHAGVLARRARLFADPPTVCAVDGANSVPRCDILQGRRDRDTHVEISYRTLNVLDLRENQSGWCACQNLL